MKVDSFRFLPRSFRPFYEHVEPIEGEAAPVWAPFEPRLAEAGRGVADGDDLGMGGGIVRPAHRIARLGDDPAVQRDHCADRHFARRRGRRGKVECAAHRRG